MLSDLSITDQSDLLHAIQTQPVAGQGWMSLCRPISCGDRSSMWPDAALSLPQLAPNLAPTGSLAPLMFETPEADAKLPPMHQHRKVGLPDNRPPARAAGSHPGNCEHREQDRSPGRATRHSHRPGLAVPESPMQRARHTIARPAPGTAPTPSPTPPSATNQGRAAIPRPLDRSEFQTGHSAAPANRLCDRFRAGCRALRRRAATLLQRPTGRLPDVSPMDDRIMTGNPPGGGAQRHPRARPQVLASAR